MPVVGEINCSSCGTVNGPGSSFCKNCGSKLEDSVRYCQSCGKQLPKTSVALCPACGAVIVRPGPGSAAPVPEAAAVSPAQGYGNSSYANVSPDGRFVAIPPSDADFSVLRKMKLFGLIGMIELAASMVLLSTAGLSFPLFFGPGRTGLIGGLTIAVGFAAIAELALEIYSIFLAWSAFSILSGTDSRFTTPAKLVMLMIIGVIAAAGVVLFSAVPGLFNTPGGLILLIAMLLVLVVFLLLGLIGLLLGIWRLGTRYRDDGFKVAAVMYLIPFLSVVGAILVYASSSSLIRKFQRRKQ
ncbi:MAG: DUF973 family protein [Thermoplasmata archaeon]|nr:DUF973 family protein [Candidatus Sysuiplasma jiujiangense]MBX8640321.1 DUF973 family protein [Candidatus Sysuiplasma jiujiangense]MBX8641970.1 DUF973 family protein [Candidatus Sysuiplasma jiujiangense]